MTQEQLAERIYVSRQAISAWENDKTYPNIQIMVMFAVAFKVESLKTKNNMRTIKEIVAFIEDKTLDEIESAREDGKYPYQKAISMVIFVFYLQLSHL